MVSKVANFSVDLPDASVMIQILGTFERSLVTVLHGLLPPMNCVNLLIVYGYSDIYCEYITLWCENRP